jgi:methylated-DNA-protein-cysteine methyltransferase-like protein
MPGNPIARSFAERAYATIRAIPYGRVASYGGVAAVLGAPRAARAVGRALFELPEGADVPWWRVVNRNGEISIKGTLHGAALQRALLRGEGVKFDRLGRIDWNRFGWDGTGVPPGLRETPDADEDSWRTDRPPQPRKPRRTRDRLR